MLLFLARRVLWAFTACNLFSLVQISFNSSAAIGVVLLRLGDCLLGWNCVQTSHELEGCSGHYLRKIVLFLLLTLPLAELALPLNSLEVFLFFHFSIT